ncbi:outer membrane lipoprotein-sorting protein [Treponema sp.]|uniref:outer membrane lipoprotein-sorting protein n=1 Tax=Treponema sp. TaxID=166 RepID=UPI00298DA4F7|nr:outer membrane lipoprotein-sorting protein [Treponema sp.]MCQ2241051.1 outer membrane lipoprotein-sorting protein [Treponema sp.]
MKKIILLTIAAITSVFSFAMSKEELLKKAEDQTAFYGRDFKANYAITQEKPGQGKSNTDALMYRRDDEGKWVILVQGPEKEKGKGYLQFDNTIWFFDPVDKRFTFTSAKDKFQGTNANNSDFTPQHYYRDYSIEKTEDVKLGKFSCTLFTLKAKTDKVDYPMLKIWVTDDGLVRKKEDYSLSGQLLRTTAVPSYQIVTEGKKETYVPSKMLITDNLRGTKIGDKVQYERTQITVTNVSFAPQAPTVYTKQYLEMMSAK